MSLNLFNYLTPLDNKRISNYIYLYGTSADSYIGNEEYLKYWADNKKRLFHLLGGKLIYKFPYTVEKPKEQINKEINLLMVSPFIKEVLYRIEISHEIKDVWIRDTLMQVTKSYIYMQDALEYNVSFKRENMKGELRFQKGMKPIRALQKLINYFEWDDLKEDFERFRTEHSMIFNEKNLTGNFCISIHPLDFLTMSDNGFDWGSCMSWSNEGCYRIGPVEMMNSNNVVCCYLEGSKDWNFSKDNDLSNEEFVWNNKKYRQLFYVTNDILVGGKAYPYRNKELTFIFLDKIKELVKINLNRSYSFGPERYNDMKHIGSNYRMMLTKSRIKNKDTFKHNIIFDTKGMYNDFFNDHYNTDYWCYRNKVDKTRVVSVSGKAPCLCCGDSIISSDDGCFEDNYEGAYNERYNDVNQLVCRSCLIEKPVCRGCGRKSFSPLIKVNGTSYCRSCATYYVKICPCCNKNIVHLRNYLGNEINNLLFVRVTDHQLFQQSFLHFRNTLKDGIVEDVYPLLICDDCKNKILAENANEFETITPPINPQEYWNPFSKEEPSAYKVSKKIYSLSEVSKYKLDNLKKIRLLDFI